jgi:hypothetical protein
VAASSQATALTHPIALLFARPILPVIAHPRIRRVEVFNSRYWDQVNACEHSLTKPRN